MNAIIFIGIVILREDPLSAGILDVFFLKISYHVHLFLREVTYSKIDQFSNSFYSVRVVGCSSIPEEGNDLSLRQTLHKTYRVC